MVSLWGSQKQNGEEEEEETSHHRPASNDTENQRHGQSSGRHSTQDADERTRLLPPPGQGGYLRPDDPAVGLLHP